MKTAAMKNSPVLKAKVKEIISADGLEFKDLNGNGKLDKYEDWRLPAEERAKDLVNQMTVEEKAGLMVICQKKMGISLSEENKHLSSHNGIINEQDEELPEGRGHEYGTTDMIKNMHIRHIIVRENAKPSELATWVNTLNELAEETRLGIPVMVASNSRNENGDAAYGVKDVETKFTAWPGTLGIAATRDLQIVKEFAEVGRKEFKVTNIRKGYMYMADAVTDPRWFRTFGTFGEEVGFISEAITTIIKAYQGEQLSSESIGLTIKHFPGGGARENGFDPHYEEGKFNVYPTEGSLEKYHLPPFIAAIKANPSSIMPYYAIPSNEKSATPQAPFQESFEEVGFAYNKAMISGLLRGQLGFTGYVNSDSGVLSRMAWGVEELTLPERVAKALEAGTDIMSGTNEVNEFVTAMKEGLVSEERVNESLVRLLKEYFELGLFENPYCDPEEADNIVNTKESQELAYKAHQKSVVLLKNKENLLPLTPEKLAGKKVYVELLTKIYSDEELEKRRMAGNAADPRETIKKFQEFIREDHSDITFTNDYHEADYAILFLEPSSGSYFDATETYLELNILEETGVDLKKIDAIREVVPNVIMNVNFNLPFLLTNVEPMADAMLAGFNTYAQATLDVILGNFNPEGKLPITLPGSDAAIAVDENGICASPNDVPGYDKEKYMNGLPYFYVDSEGNKYRYGFGLSYKE